MNNRRNYAYFSDLLLRNAPEPASAGIETRVSAADPTEYGFRRDPDYRADERDEWCSNPNLL